MNSGAFTATVSAITDAFGDPTRRSIYLIARDRSGPEGAGVTASEVAKEVGVHANVARHHLDKLAAGGYLEVTTGRAPGAKAGRPSKRYVAVGDALEEASFPVRSDDLLLSLLGRTLSKLPHDEAEQLAEEVGAEYGRAMAAGLQGDALKQGQRSLRSAIQAVADALTAHGFAAQAESRNDQLRIINNHCPFGVYEQAARADAILWVLSATRPDRSTDAAVLGDLRAALSANRLRRMPPMTFVLTHIDQVRPFQEWSPPYNLADPASDKSRSIRAAIEAVADDMQIESLKIVPIMTKTVDGAYNIETLWANVLELLPAATNLQLARALDERVRAGIRWGGVWRQAMNAGLVVGRTLRQPNRSTDERG